MSIQALREQRDAKAKAARELVNKAGYTPATDNVTFDALIDEVNGLEDQIKRIEISNSKAFDERETETAIDRAFRADHDAGRGKTASAAAFAKWARLGDNALTADERGAFRADLSVGTNSAGGFTVQTDLATSMLDALRDFGGMRRVATILRTAGGNPMQFPASDGTAELGAIVAENAAAADLDPVFTQIPLPVFKYSSLVVPISIELLMDSAVDIEGFVTNRLVNRLGRIQNRHFTIGTGSGQPFGVMVAATVGRAGTTGSATSITYDELVDLEHSVDIEYRRRPDAAFMMNDLAVRQIRKVKDTAGMPIFARGVANGPPEAALNSLLGYRLEVNNEVAVMAANARSIAFGAFGEYTIRDVLELTMQRYDDSAYAKKGQVGFNAWMRSGGNLIDNGNAIRVFTNSAT